MDRYKSTLMRLIGYSNVCTTSPRSSQLEEHMFPVLRVVFQAPPVNHRKKMGNKAAGAPQGHPTPAGLPHSPPNGWMIRTTQCVSIVSKNSLLLVCTAMALSLLDLLMDRYRNTLLDR